MLCHALSIANRDTRHLLHENIDAFLGIVRGRKLVDLRFPYEDVFPSK